MAFEIPQAVLDFFDQNPTAKDVFVDYPQYENTYLNNFRAKAIADAKKNGRQLFYVKQTEVSNRIYPTSFLYRLVYDRNSLGNMALAFAAGEGSEPSAQTASAIATAFDTALGLAAILASPTEVVESPTNVFEIRIRTASDIEISAQDGEGAYYQFNQSFLD